MGPIKGAPDWQSEVVKKLEEMEAQYIIANPRIYSESDSIDLDSQIAWESWHLCTADIILCYIPKPDHKITGRTYEQTTRFELGEYLSAAESRNQKILICIDDRNFPGRNYIKYKVENEYSHVAEWFEYLDVHPCNAIMRLNDLWRISGRPDRKPKGE